MASKAYTRWSLLGKLETYTLYYHLALTVVRTLRGIHNGGEMMLVKPVATGSRFPHHALAEPHP
jgi:hypothetical protein